MVDETRRLHKFAPFLRLEPEVDEWNGDIAPTDTRVLVV